MAHSAALSIMLLQTGKLQKSARAAILQKGCELRTNTSLHTPLQALQTTFLAVCTEAHQCKVSTRTLAPLLLLLHLELLQELQPASLAAATPPNYTALQLHSKLPPSSTSATAQLPANRAAWPQPRLHLCTRGLPSHSTSHLQRSCICCLVRPLHAVSLQWLQRLHLCNCTSGWKRHRLHLHCRHPNEGFLHAFSLFQWFFNGFRIEIQYTAIVAKRAQRAPVEVFSMHPAFSTNRDSIHCYCF